jgi:hypothetical protein
MPAILLCPSCNRKLRLPGELVGKKVQCPGCGTTFAGKPDEDAAAQPQDSRYHAAPEPGNGVGREPPADVVDEPPVRARRAVVDDDDYPAYRPARRTADKPAKVQAIGAMMLAGGILAIILSLSLGALGIGTMGVCCLWPGTYYCLVTGILATVKGGTLLGRDAHLQAPPRAVAIMQIVNIINLDMVNCVLGILALVFLNDEEVRPYFRG